MCGHPGLNRLRSARRRPGDAASADEAVLWEIASIEDPDERVSARDLLRYLCS